MVRYQHMIRSLLSLLRRPDMDPYPACLDNDAMMAFLSGPRCKHCNRTPGSHHGPVSLCPAPHPTRYEAV